MEQNKSYIIIIAVTLVSAAVIAAGLFLFSPADDAAAVARERSDNFDPFLYMRAPETGSESAGTDTGEDGSGAETAAAGAQTGATGQAADNSGDETGVVVVRQIYGTAGDGNTADDSGNTAQAEATSASDINSPVSTAAGDESTASQTTGAAVTGTAGSNNSNQNPADSGSRSSTGTTASSSTGTSGAATASSTATGSAPSTDNEASDDFEPFDAYWIQVLASPSLDNVELARSEIGDYGFGGRITTLQKDDVLYYRLRYGPFTVKDEAEKFLSWIQNLEKYSGAYISLEHHSGS
jgi:cell division septation protein DedD